MRPKNQCAFSPYPIYTGTFPKTAARRCGPRQYDAPLSYAFTIYSGIENHEVERERLAAWSQTTTGPINIRMFPDDLNSLLTNDKFCLKRTRTLRMRQMSALSISRR
jgi:hypothetical protein